MTHFFFVACLVLSTMLFTSSCEKVICTPVSNTPETLNTWASVTSPTTNTLLDLTFVNGSTGFISGMNGTLLRTTDGGNHWTTATTGVTAQLRSVFMIDATKGFLACDNGQVLRTTDGGVSWQVIKTVAGNPTLNKVYFVNQNLGFVGGLAGTFLRTTDGGTTWNSHNSGSSSSIYNICFVNSQIGYICGQAGYIAKTTDGGITWIAQTSGVGAAPSDLLLNIKFADANHGFAVGEEISGMTIYDTYLLYTKDGGQNWKRTTYPFTDIALTGLCVDGPDRAYVTGGDVIANTHCLLRTTDGEHWDTLSTGNNRLSAVFLNGSTGFSVGFNGLIMKGN